MVRGSKKKNKVTTKQAKKKAWTIFSKYVRTRDALKTTGDLYSAKCVTCNRLYPTTGVGTMQAGHFIGGRNNSILYDERGVHAQCYGCNVGKKGNIVKYYKFMLKEYGQEVIDDLEHLSGQVKQMKAFEHLEVFEKYKKKFEELTGGGNDD